MGKGKRVARTEATVEDAAASASPSIFKTIFGEVAGGDTGVSIFSDGNPFRRKLKESESSVIIASSPDAGEVKKRKRDKEMKNESLFRSFEVDVETPLRLDKIREKKLRIPDSVDHGLEEDNGENPNLSSIVGGRTKKDKSIKGEGNNPISDLRLRGTGGRSYSDRGEPDGGREEVSSRGMVMHKGKRKREELEKDYEARKYGVLGDEKSVGGKIVGEKRKVVDNPADLLVSKEGFDDEDKLLRTVFVGNLPLKVKKKALLKEFCQFGEVESVRIRSVAIIDSKLSKKGAIITKQINDSVDSVHAYIVFKTEQSAHASLSHNMAVFAGNHIRVDRACPPRKKLKSENAPIYDHKRTVFVGNLPFDVKDEELYQLFCGIEAVGSNTEAVRVIRDPHTNIGKGFAYVLFKTRQAASMIAKRRNLKLRERDLRIFHAKPDSTPSKKRKESVSMDGASPAKLARIDSSRVEKTKTPLSYQGLRASKSGVQKKVSVKKTVPEKLKSNSKLKREKPEVQKGKRPAVAARKAKANAMKEGLVLNSKPSEMKRKLDSRTPESSRPNKKMKKFR